MGCVSVIKLIEVCTKMADPRNETQATKRITRAIKEKYPDAWILKVHGGGYQSAGVPDLLVCVDGKLIGLEVKHRKPGESEEHARGRASALQLAEIEKLQRAGAVAAVVLNEEEALEEVARALQ